ncbi:MAG TPA: hypothetical protein VFC44_09775 [Candidatus Saccharimonadales bacterium]|nr:hypothetical protein [Candidatus Saccharimonadales bacterium]
MFEEGLNGDPFDPPGFLELVGWAALSLFLVLLSLAYLTQLSISTRALLVIGITSLFCGVFAELASEIFGEPLYEFFMDGFARRVIATNISDDARLWADSVMTKASVNLVHVGSVTLPEKEIPSFLDSIFRRSGHPNATVYFAQDRMTPTSVQVGVDNGFQWGLELFRGGTVPQNNSVVAYRHCFDGIYVFYYSRW